MIREIKNIAFLGLGVMGGPMAAHLAHKSGCHITVYNRTRAKAEIWLDKLGLPASIADTPAQAAANADLILLCVGNDDDLRHVITGPDGVMHTAQAGAIVMDHTTVSAEVSRDMAVALAKTNVNFMDAPVSGGEAGAVNGVLTVMTGGDLMVFQHVEPIIRASYAREMRLMGPVGAGQITKMANQICIAANLQGLAEALAFGVKSGLDMDEVLAVISKGSAQSWQMENRGPTMVREKFDFGFALDWMIKDLKIALNEGEKIGAKMEITPQILRFYEELSAQGHGRDDTSALIRRTLQS